MIYFSKLLIYFRDLFSNCLHLWPFNKCHLSTLFRLLIRISALTWAFSLSHCHIFPILQHELQNYLRTSVWWSIDWSFLSLWFQRCSMLYVGFTKIRTRNDMFTVFTYECSTVLLQAIGLQPLTDLFHIHNSVFCNIHTLHFSTTFLFSFDWFLFPEVSCKWRETSFPFVTLQLLLSVYVAFGLLVISLTSCCRKIVARLRQVFRAV